jgi:hypothetical protein
MVKWKGSPYLLKGGEPLIGRRRALNREEKRALLLEAHLTCSPPY